MAQGTLISDVITAISQSECIGPSSILNYEPLNLVHSKVYFKYMLQYLLVLMYSMICFTISLFENNLKWLLGFDFPENW